MLAVKVVTISVPACSTTVEESNCLCELPAARLLSVRKCRRGGDDRTIIDGESRVSLGEEVKDRWLENWEMRECVRGLLQQEKGSLGSKGYGCACRSCAWPDTRRHALGQVLMGAMRLRLPAEEPHFAAKHIHTRPLPCVLSVAFPPRAARVSFDENG